MELRQLRYFLAFAQHMNFTRAAQEVHIAQPPFSRQLSQLEEELGFLLIDRSARPVRLTPEGEFLREEARGIVDRVDRLKNDAVIFARTGHRVLRIGFEASTLYGRLPALVRKLRVEFPSLRIELAEVHDSDQWHALKEGLIDLRFGRVMVDNPELQQIVVREEPLMAAVFADSPIEVAADGTIDLKQLAGETFILQKSEPPRQLVPVLASMFDRAGFQPRDVIEVGDVQAAVGLVAAGSGVCFVPSVVRRMRQDDVRFYPFNDTRAVSPIILTFLKERPPISLPEILGVLRSLGT